jgi:hypothetical protein
MKTPSNSRPQCRGLYTLLLCIAALWAMPTGACAQAPTQITVSGLSLSRDDLGYNDIGIPEGDFIQLSASVTPNGSAGTTVTAQTNLSTGQPYPSPPLVIPFVPSTLLPNYFIKVFPYQSNLTGPWTVTFSNATATPPTVVMNTNSIVGVPPAPTPINVTISGSGLNPTFTWSYPTSVNEVDVLIFEKNIHVDPTTGNLVPGGFDLVFAQSLPGAMNSYTLPTVLAGGFTLTPGTNYVVDLKSDILFAQYQTYFDFTPPLPPTPAGSAVYLPTIDSNGVYSFNLTVQPGTTYYIDPAVATGFVYTIGAGNPNFATVVLPALQGSEPYTISWDNGQHKEQVFGGNTFNFLTTDPLGVSSFTVKGHRSCRRP